MSTLTEIAEEHGLAIIEDACQAHGAEWNGKKAGTYSSSTAVYSFYPTKNMTTGEGGIITTNDPALDEKMRMLREHGSKARYSHEILGYNFRMTDIAAAIGIAQLERLPSFNESRRDNASRLDKKLSGLKGIKTPYVAAEAKHVYHQYTIRVTGGSGYKRDAFAKMLNGKGHRHWNTLSNTPEQTGPLPRHGIHREVPERRKGRRRGHLTAHPPLRHPQRP